MDYKLVAFKEKYPVIHDSVFLAAGVVIAADVSIAENTNAHSTMKCNLL